MKELILVGIVLLLCSFFGLIEKFILDKLGKVSLKIIPTIGVNLLTPFLVALLIVFTLDVISIHGSYMFCFYIIGYFIISLILKLLILKGLSLKVLLISTLLMTLLFFATFGFITEFHLFDRIYS